MLRRLIIASLVLLLLAVLILRLAGRGAFGDHEGPGEPSPTARSAPSVSERVKSQTQAAREVGAGDSKQILFGDLHVHTTFSFDAYLLSLPVAGGEGAHPPADACDFARWCSALDFWSTNDHAELLTPLHWRETVESVRQCNAVGGDGQNPDTVAFLGWEWTQVGTEPDNHFGHKNVILAHTDDERIPTRPIGAERPPGANFAVPPVLARGALGLRFGGRLLDYMRFITESEDTPRCDPNTDVRDLPDDCIELAATPAQLFAKLNQWGHDSIVIPHGTTWGMYSPPGSSWDKQLKGDMHDPKRQTLIEVYSGHGDSEVYRDWRAVEFDASGVAHCPEPRDDYLPSCWQAGELIRERCLSVGETEGECEKRAVTARANYAAGGVPAFHTVPGSRAEEWLDAGQCRDCAEPSFNYRPASSAQYIMALGNFDEGDDPRRFRMGFMASSDNHWARPGTGYKEVHRRGMTESGARSAGALSNVISAPPAERVPYSVAFDRSSAGLAGFQLFEMERQASFFLTGGLIAAHSQGRDRGAIWNAVQQREVYGTSGPRILLWFDLLNPGGSSRATAPMGSEVEMRETPIFQARAVGSFEEKPGCPDAAQQALGPEDIQRICLGECYHPSDQRRLITRIEVVKITPQMSRDEDVAALVMDPWKSFECEPDPSGCVVSFSDPDFVRGGRESLYYVRAFEAEAPGVNAGNVRCTRDAEGNCTGVNLCPGPRGAQDDCLSPHEPRAWSTPIWLDVGA